MRTKNAFCATFAITTLVLVMSFPVQASSFLWTKQIPAGPSSQIIAQYIPLSLMELPAQTVMPRDNFFSMNVGQHPRHFSGVHTMLPPRRHLKNHNATDSQYLSWADFPYPDIDNNVNHSSDSSDYSTEGSDAGVSTKYLDQGTLLPATTAGNSDSSSQNPTPIPMISWLLGAGILGLIGFSRKP